MWERLGSVTGMGLAYTNRGRRVSIVTQPTQSARSEPSRVWRDNQQRNADHPPAVLRRRNEPGLNPVMPSVGLGVCRQKQGEPHTGACGIFT